MGGNSLHPGGGFRRGALIAAGILALAGAIAAVIMLIRKQRRDRKEAAAVDATFDQMAAERHRRQADHEPQG